MVWKREEEEVGEGGVTASLTATPSLTSVCNSTPAYTVNSTSVYDNGVLLNVESTKKVVANKKYVNIQYT